MAIDITEIETIYDSFLEKGTSKLKELQKATQMEDVDLAKASAEIIIGAMAQSMNAIETLKRVQLIDAQIASEGAKKLNIEGETAYTATKKNVTEESRIDNLVIEATKAQLQHLATVGAGGLIPSSHDFSAANSLRTAVYARALGNQLPVVTFTAGTTYTKA